MHLNYYGINNSYNNKENHIGNPVSYSKNSALNQKNMYNYPSIVSNINSPKFQNDNNSQILNRPLTQPGVLNGMPFGYVTPGSTPGKFKYHPQMPTLQYQQYGQIKSDNYLYNTCRRPNFSTPHYYNNNYYHSNYSHPVDRYILPSSYTGTPYRLDYTTQFGPNEFFPAYTNTKPNIYNQDNYQIPIKFQYSRNMQPPQEYTHYNKEVESHHNGKINFSELIIYIHTNKNIFGAYCPIIFYAIAYGIPYKLCYMSFNSVEYTELLNNTQFGNALYRSENIIHIISCDNKLFCSMDTLLKYLDTKIPSRKSIEMKHNCLEVNDYLAQWRLFHAQIYRIIALNQNEIESKLLEIQDYINVHRFNIYKMLNELLEGKRPFIIDNTLNWVDFVIAGLIYDDICIDQCYKNGFKHNQTTIILNKFTNVNNFWACFLVVCKPVAEWINKFSETNSDIKIDSDVNNENKQGTNVNKKGDKI